MTVNIHELTTEVMPAGAKSEGAVTATEDDACGSSPPSTIPSSQRKVEHERLEVRRRARADRLRAH